MLYPDDNRDHDKEEVLVISNELQEQNSPLQISFSFS